MAGYPPGVPPIPPVPPPGYDPGAQRRFYRDQARAQRAAFRAQRDRVRYQWRSLRRGSVLGPILLIGLGILFLLIQTGHLNHDLFWAWYGQWWPLLLVGAGVVLLAEWAFDQLYLRDPQRPPYRRSVGGGVITMLLILGIAGIVGRHIAAGERWDNGAWHFDQNNLDEFFGDKHESDQNLDLAFLPGTSLAIVNPRGNVTVSGTSDDNRIHISVHKQVYARSDSEADAKAQHLSPTVTSGPNTVSIAIRSIDGGRADLVIAVPPSAATTLRLSKLPSRPPPTTATLNSPPSPARPRCTSIAMVRPSPRTASTEASPSRAAPRMLPSPTSPARSPLPASSSAPPTLSTSTAPSASTPAAPTCSLPGSTARPRSAARASPPIRCSARWS